MAVVRDNAMSKSQSLTYEAWGNKEDISPIITSIASDKTPFFSSIAEEPDATQPLFSWPIEELSPPQQNAHLEKEDYGTKKVGSLGALSNHIQIFHSYGWVSDMQRKTAKVHNGGKDEFNRQLTKAFIEHARDIEYAFVTGDESRPGGAEIPALTGGLPYFLSSSSLTCTVADGKVTTTKEHGLLTGNFVYFNAATLPTGLKKNTLYYVRLDEANPTNAFTLYKSMKGAVNGIASLQVVPTSAGTDVTIEKNNIVDLENSSEYSIANINNVMQMCYYRGGNPTTLWMNPANKARFSELVTNLGTTNRKSGDKKMNIVATQLETDFGEVTARAHLWYPPDRVDAVDDRYLGKKWFQRPQKVPGLAKKGNYSQFVIESSIGLQFNQPLSSGSIINIKE